jgi:hypothetical protein
MMAEILWSSRTRIPIDDEPDPVFVSSAPDNDEEPPTSSEEMVVALRFSGLKAFGD